MVTMIKEVSSGGRVRVCNARCHNAKKPRCTCICGGRLHGAGKMEKGLEIAWDKYKEDVLGVKQLDLPLKYKLVREQRRQEDEYREGCGRV